MARYTVETEIAAPRDVVYEIFADRENNGDFLPVTTKLVRSGLNQRQGVGAVHFLGIGKVGVSEEITDLDPGRRIAYRIVRGAPVRRHTGEITVADSPKGTKVTYTMDSDPSLPIPNVVAKQFLRGLITGMIAGARREAAKRV